MELSSTKIGQHLDALESENDPAEKLKGAQAALFDALEINDELGVAAARVVQGNALWQMSQFSEAISVLDQAAGQLAHQPSGRWHVLLHFGYGNIFRELGVFEQALEHFLAALKTAKEIQDEPLIIMAEGNFGNVSIALGDYRSGIESFLNVLKLAQGAGHQPIRVTGYINLAAAYHYVGDDQSAVDAAQKALALANTVKHRIGAHGNLGVALTGVGGTVQAKYHLEKSLEIARESGFALEQCVCSVDLADYHNRVGETVRASQLLLEGLTLAQTIDFKAGIRDCHQRLYELFRQQQNWERALHHHEQLERIARTMLSDSSDARIRHLEARYKVEQLRDRNERQRREFEAILQMRNALLSDLSHDLRNPLTALSLCVSVLRRTTLNIPSEYQSGLNKLYDTATLQIERMTCLIKDVLDMASYEAGAGIALQRTNISELLREVGSSFREQASAKQISMRSQAEGTLYILADASAIRRMLENLVSNAIKYTPAGGQVEVEARRLDEHLNLIRVKDNGVGIPADQLPRIFERFYRVPAHKEMAEGTGLGMAIVKSIVDKHNGCIEVESVVGHGTTVSITLPTP